MRPVLGSKTRHGALPGLCPGTLALGFAAAMLASSMAYAADFQEGHIKNCAGANTCTLNFAGPGLGKKLRLQHVTCRLTTNVAAPAWVVQYFDGTHGLFVPTVIQDAARRSFVATAPVTFFTGGSNITVQALLGGFIDSQLACTITGQSSP